MSFKVFHLRPEIIFSKTYESSGVRHVISDSSTNVFFTVSQLQYELLKFFQRGPATAAKASAYLEAKLGVEIEPETIEIFLENMRKKQLLVFDHRTTLDAAKLVAMSMQVKEKLISIVQKHWEKNFATELERTTISDLFLALRAYQPYKMMQIIQRARLHDPNNPLFNAINSSISQTFADTLRDTSTQEKLSKGLEVFSFFNPMPIFDRARPWIFRLITRYTFGLVAILFALCCVWLFESSRPRWFDVLRIAVLTRDHYILIMVLSYIHILFHETGHALIAYRLGARVNRMGFLLMWGIIPAWFADITDTYRLPRPKRTLVALAGVGFQCLLAIPSILCWLFFPEGSYLSLCGELSTMIFLAGSFSNLFPFFKLDGYYILTDWTGIENLYRRAFDFFRANVKRILPWQTMTPEDYAALKITAKEKPWFIVYSIVTFSFLTFNVGMFVLGTSVVYFETLHLISAVILFMFLSRMLMGMLSWAVNFYKSGAVNKVNVVWIPSKLKLMLLAMILLLIPARQTVSGTGFIMPVEIHKIYPSSEGTLVALYHKPGGHVKVGSLLFEIENTNLRIEREQTRWRLEKELEELHMVQSGPGVLERKIIEGDVNIQETKVESMQRKMDLIQQGQRLGIYSQADFQVAYANLERERGLLGVSFAEADRRVQADRLLQIALAEKQIEKTKVELKRLNEKIHNLSVRSFYEGILSSKRESLMFDQRVSPKEPIMSILDSHKIVQLRVSEVYSNQIANGADVVFVATNGLKLHAKVAKISVQSEQNLAKRRMIFNIFPNPSIATISCEVIEEDRKKLATLPFGISGKLKIYGSRVPFVWGFMKGLVKNIHVNFWKIA